MNTVRVTKEFSFEMAHALQGYSGKCAHIHGHSYHLTVTVAGRTITEEQDPNLGMVVDFSDLKRIVNEQIIAIFDHALVLNEKDPLLSILEKEKGGNPQIVRAAFQPTSENLLLEFVKRLREKIIAPLSLHSMTLRETPSSYASWFAEDNV